MDANDSPGKRGTVRLNATVSAAAEGCETAAQVAEVRALGCPYAQGFYLGMPAPSLDGSPARACARSLRSR